MPFFTFTQNNSGGYYEGDAVIIVEADTADEANARAPSCGVDFNADFCECCGERWYEVSYHDANDEPMIYNIDPLDLDEGYESVSIHYKAGNVLRFTDVEPFTGALRRYR